MKLDFNLIDVVSILIGIIGIYIAIKTKREQWQIAEKSGAFRKPNIGLTVFDCKLGNGYPDNEDWFFIHPGDFDDYAAFPVKFRIFNDGDNATEEVLISIQASNLIFRKSQLDEMVITTYPSLMNESIKQSVDEVGNFAIISLVIPPLSPKSAFDLILPFTFRPTLEDISFPVKVEKLTFKPHFKLLYFNAISITIFSGNFEPNSYQVKLGAISASTVADGIKKYINLKQHAEKKSLFKKIRNLFRNVTELKVTNFVAFDIENQAQNEKRRIFRMKLPESLHRGGWFNLPSGDIKDDINELKNLPAGSIVGVVDFEEIPKSQRRFRFKEGNLVEEK